MSSVVLARKVAVRDACALGRDVCHWMSIQVSRNKLLQLTILAVVELGPARDEMGVFVDESDVLEVVEGFELGIGGLFVLVDESDVAEFVFPS